MPDLTEQLRALDSAIDEHYMDGTARRTLHRMVEALLAAADTPIPMNSEYAEQRIAEGVERDDFVRVPREPTQAMIDAGDDVPGQTDWIWTGEDEIGCEGKAPVEEVYRAMIAAAMRDSGEGRE